MASQCIYYWVGATVTQPFNTGIQRVTRCLGKALQDRGIDLIGVKWDDQAQTTISITHAEAKHFAKWGGPHLQEVTIELADLAGQWLLLPEITLGVPHGTTVAHWGKSRDMNVAAIFYDMIPNRMPEVYPSSMLAHLRNYWGTFGAVDLALPISRTSADDLVDWLRTNDRTIPAIITCPLAGEIPGHPRATDQKTAPPASEPFRLLAIGTWEPRKNYPRVLQALIQARQTTRRDIRISIVGRRVPDTYGELAREITGLASKAGPGVVELFDNLDDEALERLIRRSNATVFGSWLEGFGLPVLESLWHGLPCICHNGSAMAEIAPGGGAVMVDMQDESSIAAGIARLVTDETHLSLLYREAAERPIASWRDYGRSVVNAMASTRPLRLFEMHDPLGY